MRIDELSAPSGRFVARITAAVTIVDRRPGRGEILTTADTAFVPVFAVPSEGDMGSAEGPLAATAVAQHTSQGAHSAAITDPAASAFSPPGDPAHPTALLPSGRIFTLTRRQTAAAVVTGPPAVDYGFGLGGPPCPSARRVSSRLESHGRDRPWPSLRPVLLPPCLPRRFPFHPAATAPSLRELLF